MDPFAGLRDPWAREEALPPVTREPRTGAWVIFAYAAVKRALQDTDAFSSAVGGERTAPWLIFQDPPRHGQLRALVARAFTSGGIAGLEPAIRDLSRRLLAPLRARGEMDLVAEYAVPLPLMVIAGLLGAPPRDYPRLREWSDAILGLAHTVSGDPRAVLAIDAFVRAHEEMAPYVAGLLRAEGLIGRIADLPFDDVLGFFELLLLAGHETTTNLVSNAVLCLLDHPEALPAARAAPERAIEEVLRFRSPVQYVFRRARHDVDVGGRTLPAGALVLVGIGAANRDPSVFPEPHRFDPARDPNPHLAFGFGAHFCLGAALSRLEARVALPDLLALEGLRRADDAPWEPREAFHVHGPRRLVLRFDA